jgi:hypothetical protein
VLKLVLVGNKMPRHTFIECNTCHVEFDITTCLEMSNFMKKYNWICWQSVPDVGNQWLWQYPVVEHYCPECAKALGIYNRPLREGRILYEY